MPTAEFSEFSYGYALTDNILHTTLPHTNRAPVFPSLIREGRTGGGYDVQIPLNPAALFLQFKIPQVLTRNSNMKPAGFSKPYYRMHLRTKQPNQHQMLLDLENSGNLVAYATPAFNTIQELNNHFGLQQVHLHSRYLVPSDIGVLDDSSHHIAYQKNSFDGWLCSEPIKLEKNFSAESFGRRIDDKVATSLSVEPLVFLESLFRDMLRVATKYHRESTLQFRQFHVPVPSITENEKEIISKTTRLIAYMARLLFDCTFALVGNTQPDVTK